MKRNNKIQPQNGSHSSSRPLVSDLRERCHARNLTVTALARQIGCARQTLYFALEMPTRYSRVYRLIQKALN